MNTFVKSIENTPIFTETENGMKAQKSTMKSCVDLFFKIGASRGKDIIPLFERAYQENSDFALRIALWARDVRGGAGERQLFRNILNHLEVIHPEVLTETSFLGLIPLVGRWDDLLIFNNLNVRERAYELIRRGLKENNGLCAKWMPRKGVEAVRLRMFLGLSPKEYRTTLVRLTNVVETPMCANKFDTIEYSKVPSKAMSNYMTAFHKKDSERFIAYKESLERGETKINAAAVYPYEIMKTLRTAANLKATVIIGVCEAQWKTLPDYMSDANVLPMVDVSGSMECSAGGSGSVTCLDVALSLGLYCADKNKGAFKDVFLTFSEKPELLKLTGSLVSRTTQMAKSKWGMNTNLELAFDRILDVAVRGKVLPEDMPSIVLVLSDMQFDMCGKRPNVSAMEMIQNSYENAGYKVPAVVFWNLNAKDNVPVSFDASGVALVSGFSPSIMMSILAADLKRFSPEQIMIDTIFVEKYNYAA